MTDITLTDRALRQAQKESGRIAIYSLRIEGGQHCAGSLAFNLADIIIDAGSSDEFGEKFESNFDYRLRAKRNAKDWITKHGAKSVKLFYIRRGHPKKLIKTYVQGAA